VRITNITNKLRGDIQINYFKRNYTNRHKNEWKNHQPILQGLYLKLTLRLDDGQGTK
jgi:hypothetical protein